MTWCFFPGLFVDESEVFTDQTPCKASAAARASARAAVQSVNQTIDLDYERDLMRHLEDYLRGETSTPWMDGRKLFETQGRSPSLLMPGLADEEMLSMEDDDSQSIIEPKMPREGESMQAWVSHRLSTYSNQKTSAVPLYRAASGSGSSPQLLNEHSPL